MTVVKFPELTCQTGRFASFVTGSVPTYKSGKVVQTTGNTYLGLLAQQRRMIAVVARKPRHVAAIGIKTRPLSKFFQLVAPTT